uniref:Uncharacterized protein n=1 Tax=Anolis carolinensis TaxID=28377 RepID=A0A803SXP4_ANOCA
MFEDLQWMPETMNNAESYIYYNVLFFSCTYTFIYQLGRVIGPRSILHALVNMWFGTGAKALLSLDSQVQGKSCHTEGGHHVALKALLDCSSHLLSPLVKHQVGYTRPPLCLVSLNYLMT